MQTRADGEAGRVIQGPKRAIVAATIAGLMLAIAPFWVAVLPPMTDVAQHVLVARIIREYANPLFAFPKYFSVSWTGAPTDLFYFLFAALQGLVGPFADAKVYLSAWVIGLWGSVFYLARAFSKNDAWIPALFVLPLAFCWYVYMGFLPFILTLPLFALSLGVWFRPIRWPWKLPILWVLLVAIFGFHIVGAGAIGIAIAVSATVMPSNGPRNGRRHLLLAAAVLLPLPILLFRFLTGGDAPAVQVAEFSFVRNMLGVLKYTGASLARPAFYLLLFWIACVGLIAVLNYRLRRMPVVLAAMALSLIIFSVTIPSDLGALWPAGPRLFPFAVILLAAGVTIFPRWQGWAAAGIVTLLLCLSTVTTIEARKLEPQFRDFLSGTDSMTYGAKLLPILIEPFEGSADVSPFWSLASAYTALRGGANPHVFAPPYIIRASPIRFLDRKSFNYAFLYEQNKGASDYRGVSCCYDYVLLWGRDAKLEDVLQSELQLVHVKGKLRLYHSANRE